MQTCLNLCFIYPNNSFQDDEAVLGIGEEILIRQFQPNYWFWAGTGSLGGTVQVWLAPNLWCGSKTSSTLTPYKQALTQDEISKCSNEENQRIGKPITLARIS